MAEQKKKNPLRDSVNNRDSSDEDDFNTSTNKKDTHSTIEPERPSEHSVE